MISRLNGAKALDALGGNAKMTRKTGSVLLLYLRYSCLNRRSRALRYRPYVLPRVIWVERTGFQNAFDMFRNEPCSERFRCLSCVNRRGVLSLPANVKSPLSPSAGSLPVAASFRLSTARRADRTDRLAGAFPQERRSTLSHCVAKPLVATERVWGELGYIDHCIITIYRPVI